MRVLQLDMKYCTSTLSYKDVHRNQEISLAFNCV